MLLFWVWHCRNSIAEHSLASLAGCFCKLSVSGWSNEKSSGTFPKNLKVLTLFCNLVSASTPRSERGTSLSLSDISVFKVDFMIFHVDAPPVWFPVRTKFVSRKGPLPLPSGLLPLPVPDAVTVAVAVVAVEGFVAAVSADLLLPRPRPLPLPLPLPLLLAAASSVTAFASWGCHGHLHGRSSKTQRTVVMWHVTCQCQGMSHEFSPLMSCHVMSVLSAV